MPFWFLSFVHDLFLLSGSFKVSVSGILEFNNDAPCEGPIAVFVLNTSADTLHLET